MRTIGLILITLFILVSAAQAEVPHLINYQGRLTNSNGDPLKGAHNITFRIYDAQTAGSILWQEAHSGIVVQKGVFSILLGSVTDLALSFDKPYYLGIKVGTDSEMNPRQRITSAGYAIRSETAEDALESVHAVNADNASQAVNADTLDGKHASEIGALSNFVKSSYTGNGSANRVTNLGFTPDYVFVSSQDGKHRFYAMGSNYWQTGHDYSWDKNDRRWKGIVANGFKSGWNGNDDRNSNKSGRLYTYISIKQK